MKVLSLFDGISCGRIALDQLGIKVDKYVAYEIDETAKLISSFNYNDIVYFNDVRECDPEAYKGFDLVIGGSPCQDLSQAMSNREGLNGTKSSLFFEFVRILKGINPKYFFFENVGSMSKDDEQIITNILNVKPLRLNSKDFSASLRNRYYWTNIPYTYIRYSVPRLNDILTSGYSNRDKARALLASDSRPLTTPVKMLHRYFNTGFTTVIFKSKDHYNECRRVFSTYFSGLSAKEIDSKLEEVPTEELNILNGVRYMNQEELERCMGLPTGYTKIVSRNKAAHHIGNGWNIPTIRAVFSRLK